EEISRGVWAHAYLHRRRDSVEMPAARDRDWGVWPVAGDGGSKARGRTPQGRVAHRPDQQSHPAHREGSCGKRDPPRDLLGRSFSFGVAQTHPGTGPTNCPSRGRGVFTERNLLRTRTHYWHSTRPAGSCLLRGQGSVRASRHILRCLAPSPPSRVCEKERSYSPPAIIRATTIRKTMGRQRGK